MHKIPKNAQTHVKNLQKETKWELSNYFSFLRNILTKELICLVKEGIEIMLDTSKITQS